MPSNKDIVKRLKKAKVAFVDIVFQYFLKLIFDFDSRIKSVIKVGLIDIFPHDRQHSQKLFGFTPASINQGYFDHKEDGQIVIEKRPFIAAGYKEPFDLIYEALAKLTKFGITPIPKPMKGDVVDLRRMKIIFHYTYSDIYGSRSFFDRRSKNKEQHSPCMHFCYWASSKQFPMVLVKKIVNYVSM